MASRHDLTDVLSALTIGVLAAAVMVLSSDLVQGKYEPGTRTDNAAPRQPALSDRLLREQPRQHPKSQEDVDRGGEQIDGEQKGNGPGRALGVHGDHHAADLDRQDTGFGGMSWIEFFTAFGAIFTGVAAFAAASQAYYANKTRRESNRAYLSAIIAGGNNGMFDDDFYRLDIQNHGSTPARRVRVCWGAECIERAMVGQRSIGMPYAFGDAVIHPNQTLTDVQHILAPVPDDRPLDFVVLFSVTVNYIDVFGEQRRTTLNRYIGRAGDGLRWTDVPGGNDAT